MRFVAQAALGIIALVVLALVRNHATGRAADTRELGRALVKELQAGNASAVYARFNVDMVKVANRDQIAYLLKSTLEQAPIGERESESVTGPEYRAVHKYGGRKLEVWAAFDAAGKVGGLLLKPVGVGPDPKAGYKTKATLRLPFDGEWWVFWGGDKLEQNYHVAHPGQRHAYDIVVRRNGSSHRGSGSKNEDYYAFGQPILSPADGTVVTSLDGIADNKPGVMNTTQIYGNHVVIDLGNGEFAVLCHFKKGSLRVKPGDRVKSGQPLGLCGNSGNSSEPHLHFHLQDRKELGGGAIGLPAPFTSYLADGKKVKLGVPVRGQSVRNAP
jgi:murein DD-endopeptidase MepM/ murein hydrolase activator NlpD